MLPAYGSWVTSDSAAWDRQMISCPRQPRLQRQVPSGSFRIAAASGAADASCSPQKLYQNHRVVKCDRVVWTAVVSVDRATRTRRGYEDDIGCENNQAIGR